MTNEDKNFEIKHYDQTSKMFYVCNFFEDMEQQRYSTRQLKKLKTGFEKLGQFKAIKIIANELSCPHNIKSLSKNLKNHYDLDTAKIALTAAYRLRDYLLRENYIQKQPIFRTQGVFLEIEKKLHRYVYEERNFIEIYANRIIKIFKDLADFLISIGHSDFSKFDHLVIFKFLPTVTTSKTKMSNLRVLLRFLFREGYIKADYSQMILSVRSKDSEVRKFLSPQKIERLLETIDRENASGKQDYLFFLLMARLGLRAIEILRLKIEDIDWDNSRLFIRGKHDYETTMPFSHEIGDALLDYLKHSKRGSDEHVFITMRPPFRKLGRTKKFNTALRAMYEKSGLRPPTKNYHLNVFRHSLATNSLNSGMPMRSVKAIMRHENVETTMVYAKYNLSSLSSLAAEWPGAVT